MNNTTRALQFIECWNNRDIDGIMGALSENCFYHNIPMDPQKGHEQIRAYL
jgi:limonene-1,2-epoxide hydrolase